MSRHPLRALPCVIVLLGITGCMSFPRQGSGPVTAFSFPAAANPGLVHTVTGTIVEQADPALVLCVVPPGTSVKRLIASVTLGRKGSVTVTTGGQRVVQSDGITVNDFTQPVQYAVEAAGEREPWLYRVIVREAETNARLSQLTLPAGARITPAFSPAVEQYVIEVPFTTAKLALAAVGQSPRLAGMNVAGTLYTGALAVGVVDFSAGQEKSFQIAATAEDGVSAARYSFTLRRTAADKTTALAFVEVRGAALTPAPAAAAASAYTAVAPYETRELFVYARPQSPFASIACLPGGASAGQAAPASLGDPSRVEGVRVDFSTGSRLALALVVKAQDGTLQQHSLEVLRAQPDGNSQLAELAVAGAALTPKFGPEQHAYVAEVPFATHQLTVRAIPQSRSAVVSLLSGQPGAAASSPVVSSPVFPTYPAGVQVDFSAGDMLGLSILVTAQNGESHRYSLLVLRAGPDHSAALSSLSTSAGVLSPAFSAKQDAYILRIPADAAVAQLTAVASDSRAIVVYSGQRDAASAASATAALALAPGERTLVRFLVIAEDGTSRAYVVQAARDAAVPGR
jgi:hypothetical protein